LFGKPIGCCVFSSWFNCSPCASTFSTTCFCTTNFNYFLRPFVTTRDIFKNSFVQKIMGENIVLYIYKVDKKISNLKINNFSWKHKKVDSIFT
jgi:hypothetical protein